MKRDLFLIVIFCFATSLFAQTPYNNGFKDGYIEGYCHDKGVGCIPPNPPIAPTPQIGESFNSYQDGYNRGFKMGIQRNSNSNQNSRQQYLDFDTPTYVNDFTYKGTYSSTSSDGILVLGILVAISPILLASDFYVIGGIGTHFSRDSPLYYPLRLGFRNSWHKHIDFEYGITFLDKSSFDFNVLYCFFNRKYIKKPLINPFIGVVTSLDDVVNAGLCIGGNIEVGNIVNFSLRYSLLGYYDYESQNNFAKKNSIEVGASIKFQKVPFSFLKNMF